MKTLYYIENFEYDRL